MKLGDFLTLHKRQYRTTIKADGESTAASTRSSIPGFWKKNKRKRRSSRHIKLVEDVVSPTTIKKRQVEIQKKQEAEIKRRQAQLKQQLLEHEATQLKASFSLLEESLARAKDRLHCRRSRLQRSIDHLDQREQASLGEHEHLFNDHDRTSSPYPCPRYVFHRQHSSPFTPENKRKKRRDSSSPFYFNSKNRPHDPLEGAPPMYDEQVSITKNDDEEDDDEDDESLPISFAPYNHKDLIPPELPAHIPPALTNEDNLPLRHESRGDHPPPSSFQDLTNHTTQAVKESSVDFTNHTTRAVKAPSTSESRERTLSYRQAIELKRAELQRKREIVSQRLKDLDGEEMTLDDSDESVTKMLQCTPKSAAPALHNSSIEDFDATGTLGSAQVPNPTDESIISNVDNADSNDSSVKFCPTTTIPNGPLTPTTAQRLVAKQSAEIQELKEQLERKNQERQKQTEGPLEMTPVSPLTEAHQSIHGAICAASTTEESLPSLPNLSQHGSIPENSAVVHSSSSSSAKSSRKKRHSNSIVSDEVGTTITPRSDEEKSLSRESIEKCMSSCSISVAPSVCSSTRASRGSKTNPAKQQAEEEEEEDDDDEQEEEGEQKQEQEVEKEEERNESVDGGTFTSVDALNDEATRDPSLGPQTNKGALDPSYLKQKFFLKEADDMVNCLHVAVLQRNVELIQNILDSNPKLVNKRSKRGDTPLHYAVYFCSAEEVKLLLLAYPKAVYRLTREHGLFDHSATCLKIAMSRQANPDVTELILEATLMQMEAAKYEHLKKKKNEGKE